ncbi:hypothetical protein AVEN_205603-1 [Araneus ventricosus]|uniref:Secreted protein n=1 Tax=Araneus ventricosus TaxID=182803 RepID=A0A4Y2F853_ARAVE|nr:hypothetical protein AVEN_205603-1 [Araneus ventricosus]
MGPCVLFLVSLSFSSSDYGANGVDWYHDVLDPLFKVPLVLIKCVLSSSRQYGVNCYHGVLSLIGERIVIITCLRIEFGENSAVVVRTRVRNFRVPGSKPDATKHQPCMLTWFTFYFT